MTDTAATDANARVNVIADEFFEKVLEQSPIFATVLGDTRYDDRLPDLGADGRAAEAAAYREVLAEMEQVDPAGLEPEQVITRDMLILVARNGLDAQEHKLYQLAIDHISGIGTMLAQVAQYQLADSPEALARM
ncbi:MAG TPA: DUF885 family protein, partial [Candidatus Limnocylindrales bacterium]|nr:DUF885 family protein [Candidatus Limnocylindrales bacterium]